MQCQPKPLRRTKSLKHTQSRIIKPKSKLKRQLTATELLHQIDKSSHPSTTFIESQLHPMSPPVPSSTTSTNVTTVTKLIPTRLFGHGVDIAHIPRFKSTIQNFGDRFFKKALHPNEIIHINLLSTLDDQATYLASRWAFKEAIIKASGKRLLFPEMQLKRIKNGIDPRPQLLLEGYAESYFSSLNLVTEVTISHDKDYALASVIIHQYQPFVSIETYNTMKKDEKSTQAVLQTFDT